MNRIVTMLFCSLALVACGPVASAGSTPAAPVVQAPEPPPPVVAITDPVVRTADGVVLKGAQALYFAELAYKGVGLAVIKGLEDGRFDANRKAQINALNRTALAAFDKGKIAVDTGAKTVEAVKVLGVVQRLTQLLGG